VVALICSGPVSADLTIEITANSGAGALQGAVLTATPLDGEALASTPAAPTSHRVTMEQIGRQFRPYILPVPRGVEVEFPNRDRTAHHVYSFSPVRSFELPLYKGDFPEPVTFDKPGIVPLGCNIHDWMIGYIVVVDAPYFTQLDGRVAVFEDLRPGSYEITIWHPSIEERQPAAWRVEVGSGEERAELSLDAPLIAARQPAAPVERADENSDY